MSVTVDFTHQAASDTLSVLDSSNATISALGSVDLGADYASNVSFTGSTMTASGNTITVVLGSPSSGGEHTVGLPTTMVWTAPTGIATESGLPDVEF